MKFSKNHTFEKKKRLSSGVVAELHYRCCWNFRILRT